MRRKKAARTRAPSASEIARNLQNYEIWTVNQGCEQVSYADLPKKLKADAMHVFDVSGRMPLAWADKKSDKYRDLALVATPEILVFIQDAFKLCPGLFSDTLSSPNISELYAEVVTVFNAWRRLRWMRQCKEKWSEADFAANVYNVFRSPALRESTYRVNCTMSLPQPLRPNLRSQALRVLSAKTVIPDCAVFIPAASIRTLSHSAKSPFKTLKAQSAGGSANGGSSFRFQSTPCAQLSDTPGFEFVSSFWEDKKPVHQMLEDAYRQNRMATAASVRHLRSLHIEAPVFGLVWTNGSVRAHVDWCKMEDSDDDGPIVFSAPYPGPRVDQVNGPFHEWRLDRPSDILQVYFLIRNIDVWTTGVFCDRVTTGVHKLVDAVVSKGQKYVPWKRVGDLTKPPSQKENINVSITTDSSPLPRHKMKGRRVK
jgi:solute carrier family 25 carnitine/acylcarnitine transporter 20/29